MPVAALTEARDLDRAVNDLSAATPAQRLAAVRRLFVERLDFDVAGGDVLLPHVDGLPASAQRVAERDGVDVVLVEFPTNGRLAGKMLAEAIKGTRRTLTEALLVGTNAPGKEWQFVYPTSQNGRDVVRRLAVHKDQPHRTVAEQLAKVYDDARHSGLRAALERAYDVEAVTKRFFDAYKGVFDQIMGMVTGLPEENERRLFCQTLCNRLMFLYFLQRKGWLTFNGDKDYLNALWTSYTAIPAANRTGNFYTERLRLLFFTALNNPRSHDMSVARDVSEGLIGRVPFLNGGLFAEDELDRKGASVSDEAIRLILHELFARFNFTITESTPYDVEVAVDPEMLGKVFEELVTGRHESGSYYTPRPIVAFMCREALKGYLAAALPIETSDAVARFVDDHDPFGLRNPEAVLEALRRVKACDPACGSGAYLLGMLHELLDLRACLFATKSLDPASAYQRKLEIIQNNLYGVDLSHFAVNIAMLRLWLSLVVDYDGPLDELPPLPNLDYKIACGDSLTAPDPKSFQQLSFGHELIVRYREAKEQYLRAHGEEKRVLRAEIEGLKREVAAMPRAGCAAISGFDWAVEFAEVFARGGFDVVLANPPYIRQELIKELKPALKRVYGDLYSGTADLCVYFYYRALQLLKTGGMLSFISSNKWFRANYGSKLRKHMADTGHVLSITDFGELPVFEAAATFPMIIIAQKGKRDGATRFTPVKSLAAPYPDVRAVIEQSGQLLPTDAIDGDDWLLTDAATAQRIRKMEASGTPLGKYVRGQILYGIKTGFNPAFVIDSAKHAELIAADPRSAEVIKPLAVGDDIRKWCINYKGKWLIFSRRGIDIDAYPAIKTHLMHWRTELSPKPSDWPTGKEWAGRKSGSYKWYEIQDGVAYYSAFDQPKIVFPDIAKESRFTFDTEGRYLNNTTYFIPISDLYLLGVLNSEAIWSYAKERLLVLGDADEGGRLRFFTQFVQRLPIPDAPSAERAAIAHLAQKCLDMEGQGPDVAEWEAEINARVARLYGLTAAEIAAIEGARAQGTDEDELQVPA